MTCLGVIDVHHCFSNNPICTGIYITVTLAGGILKSIFATQLQADNISFIGLLFKNLILLLASEISLFVLSCTLSQKRAWPVSSFIMCLRGSHYC